MILEVPNSELEYWKSKMSRRKNIPNPIKTVDGFVDFDGIAILIWWECRGENLKIEIMIYPQIV